MKTIKILKNLGYMFYFFTGLTPIVFVVASMNADGGFPDSVGVIFAMFGIIFYFLGLFFSSTASVVINRKLKNQSSDLANDASSYLESKKDSKKMFKIGFRAFVGVGFMLVSSVIIFWDGTGDNLEKPYLVLLAILTLVGVISWTLAIMRYFRK